jgi:outer membrane biosynthesis protein TonB
MGIEAYNNYINTNRRAITGNDCESQHGRVILLFKVNSAGRPVDISVLRSVCQAADREAIRLLQSGPDWTVSNLTTRLAVDF